MKAVTKILDVHQETPSVTSYMIEKPAGFDYQPGQYLNIEIPLTDCDNRCNRRNSSIVTSPLDDYLEISMRHGVSRFKQTFEHIEVDTPVTIMGPFGRFTLNEDPTVPGVFLTGGIGITPFHSMIKYATVKKLTKPMTIIVSNRNQSDIPFKKELDQLDLENDHLVIYHTLTREEDPSWNGKRGRIDEVMIRELAPQLETSEFYTCGPPAMVTAIRELLQQMNIPKEKVHLEQFIGY